MNQDFLDLLHAFSAHSVRFLIVGAYAPGDVLTELSGLPFADAWPGRVQADFGSLTAAVIGRADFIKNKRATGRTKDAGDIEALGG
jgi:hypothetical protein